TLRSAATVFSCSATSSGEPMMTKPLARISSQLAPPPKVCARCEASATCDVTLARRFAVVAGRIDVTRIHMQATAVEIFGGLLVEPHRLLAALGDADELQEARAIGIAVLAKPLHLAPEAHHRLAPGLVAEIGEIAVDIVHLGAPLPGLDRAAARDPDRRVRLLQRMRPDVDVAE